MEHVLFKMAGLVDTTQAMRNVANEDGRAFVSIDEQENTGCMVTRGQFGSYNGKVT
jgi:hypothetical protein